MADLEIIKQIEQEINRELEFGKNYKTDENNNVILLNLADFKLNVLPESLFKLENLEHLDLYGNKQIKDYSQINRLTKLYWLNISENNFNSDDLANILRNCKSLKWLYAHGDSNFIYLKKNLLEHNLLLSPLRNYDDDEGFFFEDCDFFPPYVMTDLGYRQPKFYLDNYQQNYIDKYLKTLKSDIKKDKKDAELKLLSNQIISILLKNFYSNYKKVENLPFAIRKLSIHDFHEMHRVLIDNIAIKKLPKEDSVELNDPKWIFITGENGYGKTLLLQSIAIGLYGDKDENQILAQEGDFYLEFKNNDEYSINAVGGFHENFIPFQHFAAYGPARLVKKPGYEKDSRTSSLFKPYSELLDIEAKLKVWKNEHKFKHLFDSAINILETLLAPQIEKVEVKPIKNDLVVRYFEKNDTKGKSFEELASGYRSIITMVGDIFIRLLENQPEISDFSELAGIVLIDEIDLHMHPKWQKQMVVELTRLFTKIQFIASTHSPIPILGAPENTVIINVQKTEKGITAEKLDVDFTRLLPNSILTSSIFDFDEIVARSKPKDKFPHTEDNYEKIVEKEKLQKEIAKFLGKNSDELLNLINSESDAENK